MHSVVFAILWCVYFVVFIKFCMLNFSKKNSYTESIFYTAKSFPMHIIYQSNGVNIKNIIESIQDCISNYNQSLNYQLFTTDKNKASNLTITIQNSIYSHGCLSNFDGRGGVLAHATLPPNRLICLDASEDWQHRKTMLKRVLIHEFGHVLGLEHAFNLQSVMSYNNNFLDLQQYDIKCLQQIYPFMNH